MNNEKITIIGARENNLKNIDIEIPRNELIVFTGVSGSGKSTLAFDTIYAEGQRRYIESLSSYARQFLGQSQKPDVDRIDGLSPAIAIDQKTTNHNPRSTVGTVTEIYDYLRLLFSKIGHAFCPNCNKEISKITIDQIIDQIVEIGNGEKIIIMSPIVRGQKGSQQNLLEAQKKSGYSRVCIDGNMYELEEEINLDKNKKHNISVVIDRVVLKDGVEARLTESVELALKLSEGLVEVAHGDHTYLYSTRYSCEDCGYSIEEIAPRLFSFNSPFGACEQCSGLGYTMDIDEKLVLKNQELSINEGAFNLSGWNVQTGAMASMYMKGLSKQYGIDLNTPIKNLSREQLDVLLYGTNGKKMDFNLNSEKFSGGFSSSFEGLVNNLKRRYAETTSELVRFEIGRLMKEHECEKCHGKRLKREALSIKIKNYDITEISIKSVKALIEFFESIKLNKTETQIATPILKEILSRLLFLKNVGLSYLTLSRTAETLSGGESQRIRLATQIGSGLVGVLYILDEPSIGLHQSDNDKLLASLKGLKELGNTLIVVEHDEDTIRCADHIVDIGPMAGVHGGQVVAQGTLKDIETCKESITGDYLSGRRKIEIPSERRKMEHGTIRIVGAKQNNLKSINVEIPLGCLTVVTGVSGSGKSSLIDGVVYPFLSNKLNRSKLDVGEVERIEGFEQLDKVINIDQSPIGKTPRSNPATYTGVFSAIRELFASTKDAKERGYTAGRFSFNVSGGRCEACEGAGEKEIEMFFLPDIHVPCEVCKGKRYNRETLEVKFKGKTISDILNMTVEEALTFFENIPSIKNKIQSLYDVGLSYIKLGQSSTTLSGGEAQRVKLATELSKRGTGKTIYFLDEPTTGLHMYDVEKLIKILQVLVNKGNTIVVIEHNLDVIKVADHIIDLGPNGGDDGGKIVCVGTPEQIADNENSLTGKYLRKILKK